jgi:hypothetical protein
MAPQFTSSMVMVNFFNTLKGANFNQLLKDDFGIEAPADVPPYQKEYLWKYMVQGMSFKNLQGPELVKYAADSTENLVRLQPHLALKGVPVAAVPSKTGRTRVVQGKQADGTVLFLEHRQVWVGYWGGKIQCSKKTQEAAVAFLKKFA